ncbi:hypothetical protein E4U31_000843 [Claviceps sp. LM219 group G6]|nr:hypothetical protein E4U31_000843 [Claviceps sp. LM219 group G6]
MATTTTSTFANYPNPVEGPATTYEVPPESNPVLRGYPLVAGSALYVYSASGKITPNTTLDP